MYFKQTPQYARLSPWSLSTRSAKKNLAIYMLLFFLVYLIGLTEWSTSIYLREVRFSRTFTIYNINVSWHQSILPSF